MYKEYRPNWFVSNVVTLVKYIVLTCKTQKQVFQMGYSESNHH